MTRWVAQTQENYVSATPYNVTRKMIHGFQATRQPAIWMGESGSIALVPGVAVEGNAAGIEWEFDKRGLPLDDRFKVPGEEIISPSYYAVELSDKKDGHILVEQTSTSRAAHFRIRFNPKNSVDSPYIYIDVARPSISGWLPMWKNIVETNIMVGTHADSLIAEAVKKGVTGFDRELAWQAVWKDATVPPKDDATTQYDDREEFVDYELTISTLRAPLALWIMHVYDDYAAYVLAKELGKPEADFLLERSLRAPFTLWNEDTGFFEARNADGSWAGEDRGWTEGDK
ncbi:hypothetical protein AN958_07126 [Leucoagaricus sp. SymC.cos]|nr:hypothetical protein AN958_07126 [Leucoagaricus sp. SymC.cos]